MLNLWTEGRVMYVRTEIPELLEGRYRNAITMLIHKDEIRDIFILGKVVDYHCTTDRFVRRLASWKVVDDGSGGKASGEGTKKSEHPDSDTRFSDSDSEGFNRMFWS